MKMKKLFICMLSILIFISFSFNVYGTKPIKAEDPTMIFDVIPIEDTDVYVKSVRHRIDFANTGLVLNNYESKAIVTSTYSLINPGETKNIKLALPIYMGYNNEDLSIDIDMMVNNTVIKSELYFNMDVDYSAVRDIITDFDLSEMLTEDYRISEESKGKLYVFKSEQQARAFVKYGYQDKAFISGLEIFNREVVDGSGKATVQLYNSKPGTKEDMWVFSNSENIEISAGVGTDLSVFEISYNDLIERYIESNNLKTDNFTRGKIARISKLFNKDMEEEAINGVFYFEYPESSMDLKLLTFMIYDVTINGIGVQNDISISYMSPSGIDEGYNPPTFSMVYLPNFASKWMEFKNLEVKIIPSESNKYIVSSSHNYSKTYEDAFLIYMNEIIDEEITFSISSSSKPKRVNYTTVWIFILAITVLPIIAIVAIIFGVVYATRKKKSNT